MAICLRFLFIFFAVFLLQVQTTKSQEFHANIELYTIKNGLSQSTINRVAQDSLGFIWVATQDGLNRFDGYSFRVFRHDPEDTTSIADNYLTDLKTDGQGKLWMFSNQIVDCFDPVTEKATHYSQILRQLPNWSPLDVINLFTAPLNNLVFFSGQNGLIVLDPVKMTAKRFQNQQDNPRSLISNSVSYVLEDNDGIIWVGTRKGLCQFNPGTQDFNYFSHAIEAKDKFKEGNINVIFIDKKNQMWLGGTSGLQQFDRMTSRYSQITSSLNSSILNSEHPVSGITEDDNGNLWLLTYGNGLKIYNPKAKKLVAVLNTADGMSKLSSDFLNSIYRDKSGIIWVGTDGAGLNKIDPRKPKFSTISNFNYAISDPVTMSIFEDTDGLVWVGTFGGGINIIDRQTRQVKVLRASDPNGGLSKSDRIMVLFKDSSGLIWIGTQNGGLSSYNPTTKSVKLFKINSFLNPSAEIQMVVSIIELKNGTLLVGTSQGVFQFNRDTGDFKPFKPGIIPPYPTNSMTESENNLFFGTDDGLVVFDLKTNKTSTFTFSETSQQSLSHNTVNNVAIDLKGRIWVSTVRGLNLFNQESGVFQRFFEKTGLPNSFIYCVVPDDQGNLWISTNGGLSRFSPDLPEKIQLRNYDESDGLQSNEFNQGAFHFNHNSKTMFFGGINGINYFKPSEIKDNPHLPPIVITNFRKLNTTVNLLPFINTEKIVELDYRDYFFSFEFAALDYTNPEKNQYQYKLEGFDKEWVSTGNRRFITFTNLDPGTYTLMVRATNNDGVMNEAGIKINIDIIPPFWRTKTFIISILIIIIGCVAGYIRYRAVHLQMRNRELETIVQQKTSELKTSYEQLRISQEKLIQTEKMRVVGQLSSGIAHDLNNILSIILGSATLLSRKLTEATEKHRAAIIEKAALDGAYIISRLQEFSKQSPENHLVKTDVNAILQDVIEMTSYRINERQKRENITIQFIDRRKPIPSILGNPSELRSSFTNLVLNAIDAFHDHGTITLETFEKEPSKIQVIISDTGSGMDKETTNRIFEPFFTTKGIKGSGLGLSQVFGTISRHDGTIEVSSQPGKGTTFVTTLPTISETEIIEKEQTNFDTRAHQLPTGNIILVLEDEEEIRSIYQQILDDLGIPGLYAATGEDGLEYWFGEKDKINLIISDIGLPGISGWDFIREVRKTNKDIPIMVITGWGNEITASQIKDLTVNKVITKPFTISQLVSEIQALLPLNID